MRFFFHLNQWSQLKYALLNWFTDPKRILVPLLLIGLVTLCLKVSPYKKFILQSICALVAAYLLLISPLGAMLATKGLTLFLSPDAGQTADAIVILGRGPLAEQERTQAAAKLWQAKRAPSVLMTGRGEAPRLSTQLVQLGVPLDAQLIEHQARTTEENAVRSFKLLTSIDARRIILVTDQPHMLRSMLTFRSFGFDVIPHTVRVPNSLPTIEKTALALREYVGLVSYALIGRFQPRATSVARLNQPSIEIVMQMK